MNAWNSLPAEVVKGNIVKEFKHAWDRHKAILDMMSPGANGSIQFF